MSSHRTGTANTRFDEKDEDRMKRQMLERKGMVTVPPTLRRVALLVSICLLAACSKVTAENYAKLRAGMSYKEVSGILGNPTSCDDALGFKSCQWGDAKSHVTVRFAGDAVILYSAENLR
jgi:hypothetical protein